MANDFIIHNHKEKKSSLKYFRQSRSKFQLKPAVWTPETPKKAIYPFAGGSGPALPFFPGSQGKQIFVLSIEYFTFGITNARQA